MKMALIYYSLTGNTEYVAKEISKRLNVDVFKINLKKDFPKKGFKKYFICGKSASLEEDVIFECKCDLEKYDSIIFGTPIWASNISSPLRSYINYNIEKIKNKKIYVYLCYMGGGESKALNKLSDCLKGNTFQHLVLRNPLYVDNSKLIESFCKSVK